MLTHYRFNKMGAKNDKVVTKGQVPNDVSPCHISAHLLREPGSCFFLLCPVSCRVRAQDASQKWKSQQTYQMDSGLRDYEHTPIEQLRRFVHGIKMDIKVVRNCITSQVSNGIVEGFVNKIKEVKRFMFGRASLNLLKRKLIMEPILFN